MQDHPPIKTMKPSTKGSSFLTLILYWLFFVSPIKTIKTSTKFSFTNITSAVDAIDVNSAIKDDEIMISSSGEFVLRFFSPGNSTNRYVGIWYSILNTTADPVWVANRETPIRNTTSGVMLAFDSYGQLAILDKSNNTIWYTSLSTAFVRNPIARLLDSGNLVVREMDDDRPENYYWQSFDYPTDTLIPGMHIGYNLETPMSKERSLSSWRSDNDPAVGDYTVSMDVKGDPLVSMDTGYPQLFKRRGDTIESRIGPWDGESFNFWNRGNATLVKPRFFMSTTIVYFSEDLVDKRITQRLKLSPNGDLQRWCLVNGLNVEKWEVCNGISSDERCEQYNYCKANAQCIHSNFPICKCLEGFVDGNNIGCARRAPLNCTNDKFFKYTDLSMPDTRTTWYNESLSLKECEKVCLENCSCTAYTNLNISDGGSGCIIWLGDLADIKNIRSPFGSRDIYIRLAASELAKRTTLIGSNGKKKTKLIAIWTSLVGIVLLGLSLALFIWKRKKNDQNLKIEGLDNQDLELPMYDLLTVNKATNSLSNDNKLGEGGFGPVYKGVLDDGKEVAIKRLSTNSSQGIDEFKNEVICIAKLQHRNLVKLVGCCIQEPEKMLIYEYMANKSLDFFLFDKTKSLQLDWKKRFHIINGIARGMLYLHQDSRLRVIHRDLKVSNVLLDDDLNPKISDFGLARIFGGNETEANTNRVVGTFGYMSPEYAEEGLFSLKSDVYSFGIVMLEIVSGQKNRGFRHEDQLRSLTGHAWILYKEGKSLELVDLNIVNSVCSNEFKRSIHVALLCIQQLPEDRPTMSSVVVMLSGEGILPQPKEPGFFAERRDFGSEMPTSMIQKSSSNKCTITQLEGR